MGGGRGRPTDAARAAPGTTMGSLGGAAGLLRRPLGFSCTIRAPLLARCRCHGSNIPVGSQADSSVDAVGSCATDVNALDESEAAAAEPTPVFSRHIEHVAFAASRIARLSNKGLLTNKEAGRLSDELADCLKLHRQYMAAIESHAAVAVTDCVRAFRSDQQLAHVLQNLRPVSLPSLTAPSGLEMDGDSGQGTVSTGTTDLQNQEALLRSMEQSRHQIDIPGRGESDQLTAIDDIPPWPWDPLPASDSETGAGSSSGTSNYSNHNK